MALTNILGSRQFKRSKSPLLSDEERDFWSSSTIRAFVANRDPRAYRPGGWGWGLTSINGSYAPTTSPMLFAMRDANVARMSDPNRPGGATLPYLRGSAEDPNRKINSQAFMRQMLDANRQYGLQRQRMKSDADRAGRLWTWLGQRDLGATAAASKAGADRLGHANALEAVKDTNLTRQGEITSTAQTERERIAADKEIARNDAFFKLSQAMAENASQERIAARNLEAERVHADNLANSKGLAARLAADDAAKAKVKQVESLLNEKLTEEEIAGFAPLFMSERYDADKILEAIQARRKMQKAANVGVGNLQVGSGL